MQIEKNKFIIVIFCLINYTLIFAQQNINKIKKPFVTGYVEVNDNNFNNIGRYKYGPHNKELFSIANVFAANINADSITGAPKLYLNESVSETLNSGSISYLHSLGTKVLLDVLGNHQDAGWGCFTSYEQADSFAIQCADVVKKYNLDGIDIDDEYSDCSGYNDSSLVICLTALRKRLGADKLITMVVFNNYNYFHRKYKGKKAGDVLDLMIEETYESNDFDKRLKPFIDAGISIKKMALGTHLEHNNQELLSRYVVKKGLACVMVYGVDGNSKIKLSKISNILYKYPTNF